MDPLATVCSPYPLDAPDTLRRFDDEWRTEAVLALAFGIRADGAFDRMPILADALEEAGCDDLLLLNHCRYCEQHTPDCWVLECVLPGGHELWVDAITDAADHPPPTPDEQSAAFSRVGDTGGMLPISAWLIIIGAVVLVAFGLLQVFRTLVFGPPPPPSSGITGTAPASSSPSPPSPRR